MLKRSLALTNEFYQLDCGAGHLMFVFGSKGVSIWDVKIHPKFQGRGYGRRLMNEALDLLRERGYKVTWLRVDPNNSIARHLYESLGFEYRPRLLGTESMEMYINLERR
jgi:ribosomal protein S18 acetylase RimI-like enzyme